MAAALVSTLRGQAAPVIDGTVDAEYGNPLQMLVQNTNTQFGNAINGDQVNGGSGSEIDAVYAKVVDGRLHVIITGNLEANFNKLEVFLDTGAGGVNTINGAGLPGGVDGFCCGGFTPPNGDNSSNIGALQKMHGLTFDAGITANHYLTFTHGFESALTPNLQFWALSAHYANLSNTTAGESGALGIQLAPKGLPHVLRAKSSDFNSDGQVDGDDLLTWQRNLGTVTNMIPLPRGDATFDGTVNADDLAAWQTDYGFQAATSPFGMNYYAPTNIGLDNSNAMIGPALPSLNPGELIDKAYAMGAGGATDVAGTGAVTRELEFVLPPIAGTNNAASHRDMLNTVELRMAIDNSNTAGVSGVGPYTTPTVDNPAAVTTGIEFSIPLDKLGNPSGEIKLAAFVNGLLHDYASNQFAGVGILDANLGANGFGGFGEGLSGVNMNDFFGNQFVTISIPQAQRLPEPAAIAMAVCLVVLRRRRPAAA